MSGYQNERSMQCMRSLVHRLQEVQTWTSHKDGHKVDTWGSLEQIGMHINRVGGRVRWWSRVRLTTPVFLRPVICESVVGLRVAYYGMLLDKNGATSRMYLITTPMQLCAWSSSRHSV